MRIVIGGMIGGIAGFLYGRFIGCKTGIFIFYASEFFT